MGMYQFQIPMQSDELCTTIERAILVSGGRRDEVALVSGAAQGSRRTHLVLVAHNVVLNTSISKASRIH